MFCRLLCDWIFVYPTNQYAKLFEFVRMFIKSSRFNGWTRFDDFLCGSSSIFYPIASKGIIYLSHDVSIIIFIVLILT